MSASVAEAVATLGERSAKLDWNETPDAVQDRTLLVVFDTLGVMMAGAATPEIKAFADQHAETGPAPLAGLERWATAVDSCWVNGAASFAKKGTIPSRARVTHVTRRWRRSNASFPA